ncbi:ClbS/DfsB family four-helix bundle protein [uncultured Desulfobacter sp.]|uniref:ClbS/DfsB family four-helix bundle protein n=1 Tax=uncultured Desulfobacter sp. TaxID=240139 RepID=UPI002AAB8E90|nr:ClbS/DfsB family four-helix bundle protein [uncultured Desulfobacter sp.]
MAVPANKEELLKAIQTNYKKLKDDLINIPSELTETQEMEGHVKNTQMSVCNLMAYLVGWGNLVLKWHKIYSGGTMPDLPETGFKMNEMGRLAQKFYKDYENDNFKSLLKQYDEVVSKILDLIESLDNKYLYETGWYKKYPFGRMIQFNTSSPYANARSRIRKWKKSKGIS